jgi:hypothetical protein
MPIRHLVSPQGILVASITMLAVGASADLVQAIDFSPLPRVFLETFQGETSSPTTPDEDYLGTGGVISGGTFTGTVAQLAIGVAPVEVASYQLLDVDLISTRGSDHGFRVDFDNLSVVSDGSVALASVVEFSEIGSGAPLRLAVGVIVTQSVNGNSASLQLAEVDFVNPDNLSILNLTEVEATAILNGAVVRVDGHVDHDGGFLSADVAIDGTIVSGNSLSLLSYGEHSLSNGVAVLGFQPPTPPTSAVVDVLRLEAYAQPMTFEPLFNIDVGGGSGTPTSLFDAAGGPGYWNLLQSSGVHLLTDVDGIPTATSALLSPLAILNFGTGYQSDFGALFGDYGDTCSSPFEWSVDFSGLADGTYRALVYASGASTNDTGEISINGVPSIGVLPGLTTQLHVQGINWDSAHGAASGGNLLIEGIGTGSAACVAVAGLQLEVGVPIPVPEASLFSTGGGSLILGLVAMFERRRRVA